ncbi:MAG: hypothetical protein AB7S75_18770 [Desulfococcaceae bacterium]
MKIEPMIMGGIVGFVLGTFGFIIGRFWVLPISRYSKIKNDILTVLKSYSEKKSGEAGCGSEQADKRPEALRKLSVALSDSYDLDIPLWYRMVLANRKEFPLDAATHLMTLANTKNEEHIQNRIHKIMVCLRFGLKK